MRVKLLAVALAAALAFFPPVAFAQSLLGFPPGTFSPYPPVSGGGGGTPQFNWINYSSNTIGSNSTSTNVGVTNANTACSTLTSGDTVIIALYLFLTTTNTITPPAGFTQIGSNQTDAQGMLSLWQHTLGAGESCSSYTFSWTTTTYSAWILVDVTGVASSPIDSQVTGVANSGGGTTITTSGITTTHSPDYLLLIVMSGQVTSPLLTAPSDMTSRASISQTGTNMVTLVSDSQPATTLSSHTETATNALTGSKAYTYGLVALHN